MGIRTREVVAGRCNMNVKCWVDLHSEMMRAAFVGDMEGRKDGIMERTLCQSKQKESKAWSDMYSEIDESSICTFSG